MRQKYLGLVFFISNLYGKMKKKKKIVYVKVMNKIKHVDVFTIIV